ncbi:MAG: YeeE/YedE family protein [Chlorobi bacterium]|nr:YeeE/YedE family protein [Chlorobiota bacterium]
MELLILFFGLLFGALLVNANLNRFNVISGMATLENLAVAKAIAMAIGLGVILLNVEIGLGLASFHVKPFILGGIILGGLIFGIGMAILGYCPGTLAVSLGEGSVDALIGIAGGLFGGLAFTLVLPGIQGILGPDLGKISLNSITGFGFVFYLLVFVFGLLFIGLALWLHKIEKKKDLRWLYTGIGLAVLNAIVFASATTNRPIGASTTFPYVADLLSGITNNPYYTKIQAAGNWEMIFLAGALLAGLIISLVKKEFKFTLIHSNWLKYKGPSAANRIVWAFVGGFVLIFGARMAGGCTSGHVISGGMQLALSSLVFAVFVFIGLLATGKLFYLKK